VIVPGLDRVITDCLFPNVFVETQLTNKTTRPALSSTIGGMISTMPPPKIPHYPGDAAFFFTSSSQ